ncbi:MAG: hypothetical protein M3Z31_04370 [Pseudomonadota bacterium]|nr:hypothetical protein [Pseudomonadota bacterium]
MRSRLASLLVGIALVAVTAAEAWELPADKATFDLRAVAEVLGGNDYPVTSGYTQRVDMIDFESYGQRFTQVVVSLVPDKPRLHNGKRVVVVGAEPGSEYAMDFIATPERKEGPGVWLARRGVTFIALTRVGRWNFLAPDGSGSWADVPVAERMPIFNRDQKAHWTRADYDVQETKGKEATSGDSAVYRLPRKGSRLYAQMLAATPGTYLTGYRKAIEHIVPPAQRNDVFLLYWGMSTGGAFLYPLAHELTPDGYLGWGTSSTGLAYLYRRAKGGDLSGPYAQTAVRLRERGLDDFTYYTKELDAATREAWWKEAQQGPRFKSGEDAPMQFNVAALTDMAMRLWLSDSLPSQYRKEGLGAFIQTILAPSFPPAELKRVAVLDMNGTQDEAIPPAIVDAHREVMEPAARKYRVLRVQDFHHYLYRQESIKVVGSLWLRFIDSGYFD